MNRVDIKDPRRLLDQLYGIPTIVKKDADDPRYAFELATPMGLAYYAVTQTVEGSSLTSFDEIGSIGAGMAASALGALAKSQTLCDRKAALEIYGEKEAVSGGSAFLAGCGIAGAEGSALTLSIFDMGTISGCTLIGIIFAKYLKSRAKNKLCPGLNSGPRHKGICTQRICQTCFCLFAPDEASKDLDSKEWMSVYELFSYLQYQGLSVFDSILIISEKLHICQWENTGNNQLRISSESLSSYIEYNKSILVEYQGKGDELPEGTKSEIIQSLNPAD